MRVAINAPYYVHLRACGKEYLRALYKLHNGKISAVSRVAGINGTDIYKKIHDLGLADEFGITRGHGNDEWKRLGR